MRGEEDSHELVVPSDALWDVGLGDADRLRAAIDRDGKESQRPRPNMSFEMSERKQRWL